MTLGNGGSARIRAGATRAIAPMDFQRDQVAPILFRKAKAE